MSKQDSRAESARASKRSPAPGQVGIEAQTATCETTGVSRERIAATSNSLSEVAARINTEHEAASAAAKKAIEHALECGRLLIEAKFHVKHGEWLSWLGSNTTVGARQSQKYMRLAEGWAEIEDKSEAESHLTIEGALSLIAQPDSGYQVSPSMVATPDDEDRAEKQFPSTDGELNCSDGPQLVLDGPFIDDDFGDYPEFPMWLQWKLSHVAGLPKHVRTAISMSDDYGVPALAMCEPDDIRAAMLAIVPHIKGETSPAISTTAIDPLNVWACLKMTAQRIYVLLFDEVKAREKRGDDALLRRAEAVHRKLVPTLERARLARVPQSMGEYLAARLKEIEPRIELSPVGLELPDDLPFETWQAIGNVLAEFEAVREAAV